MQSYWFSYDLCVKIGFIKETLGFPCDSAGKESACNEGYLGSIPGIGRSSGEGKEGKDYPLQYPDLDSPQGHKELDTTDFHFHQVSLTKYQRYKRIAGALKRTKVLKPMF